MIANFIVTLGILVVKYRSDAAVYAVNAMVVLDRLTLDPKRFAQFKFVEK